MRDTLLQQRMSANARRKGVQQFYVARGHSAEEAEQIVEQHMRGRAVGTQATIQQPQPVLAADGDTGHQPGIPTAVDGG